MSGNRYYLLIAFQEKDVAYGFMISIEVFFR